MIGRRAILKLLGIAPAVATQAGAVVQGALTGASVGTAAASALWDGQGNTGEADNHKASHFTDFATFMLEEGNKALWEEAREVNYLDPDLSSMQSLPLNTKFIIQRQRNFERRKEHQREWFYRMVKKNGFFKWHKG